MLITRKRYSAYSPTACSQVPVVCFSKKGLGLTIYGEWVTEFTPDHRSAFNSKQAIEDAKHACDKRNFDAPFFSIIEERPALQDTEYTPSNNHIRRNLTQKLKTFQAKRLMYDQSIARLQQELANLPD